MTAELEQINLDIDLIHTFIKRYGNRYWEASLQKLNRIKKQKENIDDDLIDDQLKQASGKGTTTSLDSNRKVDFQTQRKFLRDGSVLINDNVREIGIASSILAYSNSIDVSSGDEDDGPKRRVNVPLAAVVTPSTQRSMNNRSSLSTTNGGGGASVLNTTPMNNVSPAEIPSSITTSANVNTTFNGKTRKKKKRAQQSPSQAAVLASKKLSEGEKALRKDTILTDTSSSTDEEDTFDRD
ncbi:hypothetical protein FDP41_008118 [Naegleria fowleri]|uniref:Uncharacterized protein n=1 Tax=Naegleria fowleri TaxID=5763 RepID=A0A6A5BHB0_NAEFO|nr:uncharacterized protein FDP41_008118 [Naegleria fowleri]KAF0973414.1 hypothetical protein FDP41_008118 [Naegleria fowleri]